jgi:hypothetical protein
MILWKSIGGDIQAIFLKNRWPNTLIVMLSMGVLFYYRFYTDFYLWWTLQALLILWIGQFFLAFHALSDEAPENVGLITIAFRSIPVSAGLTIQMSLALLFPLFLIFYIIIK